MQSTTNPYTKIKKHNTILERKIKDGSFKTLSKMQVLKRNQGA
jgi:hypothetical protein